MKLKHRKRLLRLASLLDRSAARLRRYVKAKTPKRSAIKTIKLEDLLRMKRIAKSHAEESLHDH